MKIGLRVNKGDKEYKRAEDATVEIGIGGGQVASTITTWKPTMHNHHSNMVLEIDEMKIKNSTDKGFLECPVGGCFDGQYPKSESRRGRVQENGNVTPTIMAGADNQIYYNVDDWRIRKLTPKECWRLMGYLDKDYDNAKKENSGTQLYKQAGNAIVKQVLMAIFSQLNIKGVKAWNDMTETEKRAIIKKTTMVGE